MRRQLFLLLSLAVAASVHAQDVIVKKDGSTILSKVIEINTADVKYKKSSNPDGPTYTINTSDILSINYENGEKETFENVVGSTNAASEKASAPQGYVEKPADARNAEILALHNKEYGITKELSKRAKDTPATYWSFLLGVKSSSIMSNEDIEMTFKRETVTGSDGKEFVYYINLKNKTDRTIYIDKARSFRIENSGNSMCYYEDTGQKTVSVGGGSGASLGLGSVAGALGVGGVVGQIAGGIGVGGGTNHSVSTTFQQQRVVAIPPHGSRNLTEEKRVQTKKGNLIKDDEFEQVESAEVFRIKQEDCGLSKGYINRGEVKILAEDELPWSTEYIVTYSTEEDLSTYSSLKATLYIHEVIGGFFGMKVVLDTEKEQKMMNEYIEGVTPNTIMSKILMSEKAK